MTRHFVIGILLIVAGLTGLGLAFSAYNRTDPKQAQEEARLPVALAELDTTRAEIRKTSLLYQGFQKNTSAVPDTVRMYGGGKIMEQGRSYQKKLHMLEVRERDLNLEVTQIRKHIETHKQSGRREALPFAGGGLVALVAGIPFVVRGVRARNAARVAA